MSRWGCGGKPDCGAMRSLFQTRSAPQCTRLGSRYSAKLKWKLALSQPWSDLPSFSKGLRSIMDSPLAAKMATGDRRSSFGLVTIQEAAKKRHACRKATRSRLRLRPTAGPAGRRPRARFLLPLPCLPTPYRCRVRLDRVLQAQPDRVDRGRAEHVPPRRRQRDVPDVPLLPDLR